MYLARLFAIFVVLLLVTIVRSCPSKLTAANSNKSVGRRCKQLRNEGYKQYCRGIYTYEMKVKYKDQMAQKGMPYGVWVSSLDENRYIVVFNWLDLMNCTEIELGSDDDFCCNAPFSSIYNPDTRHIHCFMFNLQYVDDLVRVCFQQLKKLRSAAPQKNIFSALIYTSEVYEMSGKSSTHEMSIPMLIALNVAMYIVAFILHIY